ncbi:MAG: polyprenol monophosphomannose synthase [Pirellula sp.]
MSANPSESLLILVCTFNERGNLPSLFERIYQVAPSANILVVDDNSPDGTSDWVVEHQQTHRNVSLIRRSGKLGLGTAIRDGMNFAIEHGYQWLLNLDADLSHDPAAIPALLAVSQHHDIVIGSRYVSGGGMEGCSWKRVFVSRCANAYARFVIGWKVQDCSSAFRLYRVSMLKTIPLDKLQGTGYGFLEEVLWHLLHVGGRLQEVGIIYTERREGKSKISLKEALSTVRSIHDVAKLQRKGT